MIRHFQTFGAFSAMIAVGAGAISAHGHLAIVDTGARYQMYHGLALLILGFLPGNAILRAAGSFFIAGTLLFSGSLYAQAATGWTDFAYATPFGGACFMIGWACLGVGLLRQKNA